MASKSDDSHQFWDKCLSTLSEYKVKVCKCTFEKNCIAIQQALDELREDAQHVTALKTQLTDFSKSKAHTQDYKLLESEYDITEDLHLQRKRGLESLLYISEIENAVMSVQNDFETRALYLAQRPEVFKAVYRDHCPQATYMHKEISEAMKESWQWLSDLTSCLKIHLHNASQYQQYCHDFQHLEADLHNYLEWLDKVPLRMPVKTCDPQTMISHIYEILHYLLQLQIRVDRLCEKSRIVFPVHLRKHIQPSRNLRAQVLVNYSHRQISLTKDQHCTILDNSDLERWVPFFLELTVSCEPRSLNLTKIPRLYGGCEHSRGALVLVVGQVCDFQVQTDEGVTSEVPAIILIIPPPDPESFDKAQSIRSQIAINWRTTAKRLRLQLTQFMTNVIASSQNNEFIGISNDQKASLMNLMNKAVQVLCCTNKNDQDVEKLKSHLVSLRKVLGHMKPGKNDINNPTILKWKGTQKVFQMFTDLLVYARAHKHDVSDHFIQQSLVCLDPENLPIYTSKAYFERSLPSMSIDVLTKNTQVTNVTCELYIHERNHLQQHVSLPFDKRWQNHALNGEGEMDEEQMDSFASELTEKTSFAIVGVIDPRSTKQLTVSQAIQKGLLDLRNGTYNVDTDVSYSLPEAIQKGSVLVEYVDTVPSSNSAFDDTDGSTKPTCLLNSMDTQVCSVSGVIDPHTGEWITVNEAIAAGLIDLKAHKFCNPVTKEDIPLTEAVHAGYLIAESVMSQDKTLQENGMFASVAMIDLSYNITSVLDPRTGKFISLKCAVQDGVVDPAKGIYSSHATNEVMTINDALKCGYIRGKKIDPTKDKNGADVLNFQQLQIFYQKFVTPNADSIQNIALVTHDPNEKLYKNIKDKIDLFSLKMREPSTNKVISLEDAFEKGILNFARAEVVLLDGQILSLQEATARGYMEPSVLREILKLYEEVSIGKLIDDGKFDPETGLVTNTSTGQIFSLETAISNDLIDPKMIFFFDILANRIVSLDASIDKGRFRLASGKVVRANTDQELTVTMAELAGEILARIDPVKMAENVEALNVLRSIMDTKLRGIRVPTTGFLADVEEAVVLGVLDVPCAAYADEKPVGSVALQQAVKSGKIEQPVALALFAALSKLSLQEAIQSGKLNAHTGKFKHPYTSEAIDLKSSRQSGMWNPNFVFCVDNESGNVISLGMLMDKGKFHPESGRFVSSTGKSMTLEEAINAGILTPTIDAEKYVDTAVTLKNLIDTRQVNPHSCTFLGPNDHHIPLRDALANGFLTLNSKVKQDSQTGDVFLAQDEHVVEVMVTVKENTDWLSDIERALASQVRPSQHLEKLHEQTQDTQTLLKEVQSKEPAVRLAVRQGEETVEIGSSGPKDQDAQQIQKLKYNAADLKVRFGTVISEVESRTSKMVHMFESLEESYFHLEELDQWLDSAIEHTQDLKTSHHSLEEQYAAFKTFIEEVKMKEEDIAKLTKSANDFKDQAQDFEHEVDAYRLRIQIMPTFSQESESRVLEEEIESIEAKYKDISRESVKHMERLMSLVKSKKTFEELNHRLTTIYPKLQEQLANIQSHTFAKNLETDTHIREMLKNIKAEVIGQEQKLKDLSSAGERLADAFMECGMTAEVENMQMIISARSEQYSALLKEIGDREEQLDYAIAEQQNVMSRLDSVIESIGLAERKLHANTAISLDKEKLATQLQEQHLMNADISSSKALLDRLAKEVQVVTDTENKLLETVEQLGALERLADSRTRELEEISSMVQSFDAKASDMFHWLVDAIRDMKTTTKSNVGKVQKAKIHGLLEVKDEHQTALTQLHSTCERLTNDDRVTDKYAVSETLADVEGKWNELTEILIKEVSFEAVADVEGFLKYLDKAENEINTAEPISVDPETLRVQLRDHSTFHEDLIQRKNALKDIITKGRSLLHETANAKTDEIENRWDSIENQADLLCQHSADRLRQLEAALPLASHLNENLAEVESWLEEMEAELKSQGSPGNSLDEVKKQHDNLKTTQQIIDDHKLFIDDLNSTGMDLMDVCGVSEATELHNKLLAANTRHETLRSQARTKGRELGEKKRLLTQEVSDSLDQMLEDLDIFKQIVTSSDPVPALPAKLKNEIDENKAVLEDLERMKPAFLKVQDIVRNLKAHGIEDPGEVEDVKSKAVEIADLVEEIGKTAGHRDKMLKQTLLDSSQFFDLSTDILSSLRDLKDSLFSQQLPGVDIESIREQQSELAGIKTELEKAKELISDCKAHTDSVMKLCGEAGCIELQKQLEDLTYLADDVNDMVRERGDELRKSYRHADQFAGLLDSINSWLPLAEHKLGSMRPPASDPSTIKAQIEEIKLFKSQIYPKIVEMQQVNQQLDALKDQSPMSAEVLYRPVLAANDKWNDLLRGIADREFKLNDMQAKVGEVDCSMNDVIANLDQLQADIKDHSDVNGDPKFLETILRKLQLMQSDAHNQEKIGRKLKKAVEEIVQKMGEENSPLTAKCQIMMDKLRATKALNKDAENKVQDKIRQVKRFLGEVDSNLQAINDFRQELKSNLPFGALTETSDSQYKTFMKRCQELDGQEKNVQALLVTSQQMLEDSCPENVSLIAEKVKRLRDRWQDTRDRAIKRKAKMDEHRKNVSEFYGSLKVFTDWLNTTEVSMRAFVYPSKILDRIIQQIQEHNTVRMDLQAQSGRMATLDQTGTYLKHFGLKQDTIYVKNLLVGIRLRWKKILRRTDERGRLLQQAYKEDKRFHNAWHELCDWLDESSVSLSHFLTPGKQPIRSDIDELKTIDEIKKFQMQLSAKHPTFFATTRLGRNLKDRCTKLDPERDILTGMLEDLKNKWNAVRLVVTTSQNKLDEVLLTSGRVSDALHSLLEWLHKAEVTLADDLPVLGDLDTVHMLIEQHRNLQQELAAREPTVTTMKVPGNLPMSQHQDLTSLWNRVTYLCEVRENKLTDALKLAEEFQDVVTIMREFLPEAEAQLKFRSLPDDEVAILQMIEKHEKFEEELKSHQEHVDKIKILAEEILNSCHPNALRFVKYYLTITQTRWDQLLERARARGERLHEAQQRLVGLAQSLEDMLAMLTEYQALLATKEADPIPHDLNVVKELLKEHQEVYAELIKLSESEDFMKIMSSESKASSSPGQKNGSNMVLNEVGRFNPRYTTLQNKWRTVSRMAIERKKKLQDAYDNLLELESFKNFDFDAWRARYLKWIQAKKFRITDFFRRQDKNGDGFLNQEEFVHGMLQSRFPSNKTELNAVFDIFDREKRGLIDYKDFVDALKPDKLRNTNRNMTDDEVIQDAIELETSSCNCRNHFRGNRIDEGKYRFGEKQKIVLVRLLNKSVMVRVGGGWIPLEEFVQNNDPCKAKGRTNFDLRDQLLLDDTSQTMQIFALQRSGSGRISPFPTATTKRRQNDAGYASSTSSAGSGDSSLRRSRVTSSMVNLSSNSSNLQRNPDYGSTGSLYGQRSRTPHSTASSSGRRTPTMNTERRRSNASTVATPTVAFGSTVRSRPTTPNSFTSTPKRPSSATPIRPGSTTPTRQLRSSTPTRQLGSSTPTRQLGSSTPTRQLGSSTPTRQLGLGTPRHRRLPDAPTTMHSSTNHTHH